MPAVRDPEHQDTWIIDSGTMCDGTWLEAPTLTPVHRRRDCFPHPCPIHKPSDHPLRDAPLHWHDGVSRMERICSHGHRHPDPDDCAFRDRERIRFDRDHYGPCDGCCRPQRS